MMCGEVRDQRDGMLGRGGSAEQPVERLCAPWSHERDRAQAPCRETLDRLQDSGGGRAGQVGVVDLWDCEPVVASARFAVREDASLTFARDDAAGGDRDSILIERLAITLA